MFRAVFRKFDVPAPAKMPTNNLSEWIVFQCCRPFIAAFSSHFPQIVRVFPGEWDDGVAVHRRIHFGQM